jgi:hypothetical protein
MIERQAFSHNGRLLVLAELGGRDAEVLRDFPWHCNLGFCSLRRQADRVFQDAEEFPGPQGIEWQ